MSSHEELKSKLDLAIKKYTDLNYDYKKKGTLEVRGEMLDSKGQVMKCFSKYIVLLKERQLPEILKEYEQALDYFDIANKEYEPYVVETEFTTDEGAALLPYHEIEAASDKLELAKRWLIFIKKIILAKSR